MSLAASDEIIFAIAMVKCVLIVSCGIGAIAYLAWAGGKRIFSDKDGLSGSHFAQEQEDEAATSTTLRKWAYVNERNRDTSTSPLEGICSD